MNECNAIGFEKYSPSLRVGLIRDGLKVSATAFFLFCLIYAGGKELGYNWQWYRVPRYLCTVSEGRLVAGPLVEGMLVTLKLSAVSLLLSSLIGLLAAVSRLSGSLTARLLARIYLEIIRNTPLLVQLFFIYFVFGPMMDLGRFTSAVLALSLFEGAYASEIIRAGILSVDRGQWEAAMSIGMNRYQTLRHVVLPQALRRMAPPLVSQAVSLIKDSALVSTVAIYDLTMRGQEIIAETYLVFELWFTIAVLYLSLTLALSLIARVMEKRLLAN